MQGFVVFDQGMGDVVMDCIGLIVYVIVNDGNEDVEFFDGFGQFEWLMYDYVSGFMIEELIEIMVVDGNFVSIWMQEDVSGSGFMMVSVVILSC